jgi:hypothetical protein
VSAPKATTLIEDSRRVRATDRRVLRDRVAGPSRSSADSWLPFPGPPSARVRAALVAATCLALILAAWITRVGELRGATLYQDDAWVALGWRATRWIDLQRTGLSSLGFTILVRACLDVLGFSSHNARLLPFAASIAIGPLFLLVALRMHLRFHTAALGAAVLVASPTIATYSVRVKQYGVEALLATVLVGLGWAVVQHPISNRRWTALGAASIASCLISFTLAGVVVGAFLAGGLSILSEVGVRRVVRSLAFVVACVTAAALSAIYLVVVKPSLASPSLKFYWRAYFPTYRYRGTPIFTGMSDHGTLRNFWHLSWTLFHHGFPGPTGLVLSVYLLSLVTVALVRPLLAVLTFTPVALAVAASFAQLSPLGGGRTDIYLYTPMVFTMCLGLDIAFRRLSRSSSGEQANIERHRSPFSSTATLAGVSVIVATLLLITAPKPRPTSIPPVIDTMPLIHLMESQANPADLVVVGGSQVFVYPLYSKRHFTTARDIQLPGSFRPDLDGANTLTAEALRDPSQRAHHLTKTVWVVDALLRGSSPESSAARTLETLGYRIAERRFATGALLERWQRLSPS